MPTASDANARTSHPVLTHRKQLCAQGCRHAAGSAIVMAIMIPDSHLVSRDGSARTPSVPRLL